VTIRELLIPESHLQHHTNDDTWRVAVGRHVHVSGDSFVIVGEPISATAASATVIFNGLPVFTVIGDKTKNDDPHAEIYEPKWRWAWPMLWVEYEDIRTFLWSDFRVIGELATEGRDPAVVLDEIMELLEKDNGWNVDTVYEEYGGEGHQTVAFVGLIATTLHKVFPNETPDTRGF
jgi:hypothetical protein